MTGNDKSTRVLLDSNDAVSGDNYLHNMTFNAFIAHKVLENTSAISLSYNGLLSYLYVLSLGYYCKTRTKLSGSCLNRTCYRIVLFHAECLKSHT